MKSSRVPKVPLHSPIVKFVALFNSTQVGPSTVKVYCVIIENYNFTAQLYGSLAPV